MIESRQDYLDYLEADRIALKRTPSPKARLFDSIWNYQRLLRRLEYLTNCNGNPLSRAITWWRYRRLGERLGFSIPPNVFGPGLSIAHIGTIVVSQGARIGANCRIHVCVNIGTQAGKDFDAPVIGDNCYIGPGAKLFGPISIGDNTCIAANAAVNKSFGQGGQTIGGVPAKVLSDSGSEGLLTPGWPLRNPASH